MTKHHIAEFQEKRSAETREKIKAYFCENPFSNSKVCAKKLGLNYQTVLRHLKEIKAGING